MNDIQLDTVSYDILVEGKDLVLFSTQEDLTVQVLKIRLQNFRGEWFRDIGTGVPYLQTILGVRDSKEAADAAIRTTILETDNIALITGYSSTVSKDRKLIVTFTATLTSGGTIEDITVEI